MMKRLLVIGLYFVSLGGLAEAQTPVLIETTVNRTGLDRSAALEALMKQAQAQRAASTTPQEKPATADGKKAPSPTELERRKRMRKLEFDRRPSAILLAWATRPEEDEEKKGKNAPAAAAPVAAAPGTPGEQTKPVAATSRPASGIALPGAPVTTPVAVTPAQPAVPAKKLTPAQPTASVPAKKLTSAQPGASVPAKKLTPAKPAVPARKLTPAQPTPAKKVPVQPAGKASGNPPAAPAKSVPAKKAESTTAGKAESTNSGKAESTNSGKAESTNSGKEAVEAKPAKKGDDSAAPKSGAAKTESAPEANPSSAPGTVKASPQTKGEAEALKAAAAKAKIDAAAAKAQAAAKAKADAAAAKAKAEAAAAKAKAEAEKRAAELKALGKELQAFQRMVTRGEWAAVKTYLASLEEESAKLAYTQMISSLARGPKPRPGGNRNLQRYDEKNVFAPDDVLGLMAALPRPFTEKEEKEEKAISASLGRILAQCIEQGHLVEHCLDVFRAELGAKKPACTKRQVARLLFGANQPLKVQEFLPEAKDAEKRNDREALNLLSRYFLALHSKEGEKAHLESAWDVLQAALAAGKVTKEEKEEALRRAVQLAPRVRSELGDAWLTESFTRRPERGIEILAAIGSSVAKGMRAQARQATSRLATLKLQTTAANALLKAAPERAEEWQEPLRVLAGNWLREASFSYKNDTSTRRGPQLQRDRYGNFYYNSWYRNSQMPAAIPTGELLDVRPSAQWLKLVNEGLRPKFSMTFAQLLLKVGEEEEAFPFIEELAKTHPAQATELVDEFLRVWTRDHNPNSERDRTNNYMYFYGFEQRAAGIPLTRSKQKRNLDELAHWVTRLRKLGLEEVNEDLLLQAFTTAHSTAEVYRLETIEAVFGAIGDFKPKTLAAMVQRMRLNLAGVWRKPTTQKKAKTNRTQKDIEREVVRGYEVARAVLEDGLEKHPEEWMLHLANGAISHDENNYRKLVSKGSGFSARRDECFEHFAQAAELYAQTLDTLPQEKESTLPYEVWFYAALGACDLKAVDTSHVTAQRQVERIAAAIRALPEDRVTRHVDAFANMLFTRMSNANPAVKFRYLDAGLAIAGESDRCVEAREVFSYYGDLVREIRLDLHIDGSDRVGFKNGFGVFVDIRHTREIERESGGFQKYLVNQNAQSFSYNYGRPTEDYRDKFEEAAREALNEQFEVLSITFNHPKTSSVATAEYGWRKTPYAYLFLKPRGPQVDRIPSLHLDVDFLDTSGHCILPIISEPVPIDAEGSGEKRPFADLAITQVLDERQASKGRLILEVKATAQGVIPALQKVLDFKPKDFIVAGVDDAGASIVEFAEEGAERCVRTERRWTITLEGRKDLKELPERFSFGAPLDPNAKMLYQRFNDADLASVGRTIDLRARYGEKETPTGAWIAILGFAAVLAVGAFLIIRSRGDDGAAETVERYRVPEEANAFTVLGLLEDIEANATLSDDDRAELGREIGTLREHFFGTSGKAEESQEQLAEVARRWVAKIGD